MWCGDGGLVFGVWTNMILVLDDGRYRETKLVENKFHLLLATCFYLCRLSLPFLHLFCLLSFRNTFLTPVAAEVISDGTDED